MNEGPARLSFLRGKAGKHVRRFLSAVSGQMGLAEPGCASFEETRESLFGLSVHQPFVLVIDSMVRQVPVIIRIFENNEKKSASGHE